ncbi:MAG: chemotaxis protein CheB [Pseudomonadota bacterium]
MTSTSAARPGKKKTTAAIVVIGAATALCCQAAVDGAAPLPGHVYVALPDQHMMLVENRIRITKGARENRARPAIDPLFRSAAVAYGNRVIAVVLSGYLDDGTAGMEALGTLVPFNRPGCGGVLWSKMPSRPPGRAPGKNKQIPSSAMKKRAASWPPFR